MKIKDEVALKDWVYAIIVPMYAKKEIEPHVSDDLKDRVHYLQNDCEDIWKWSEKVYEYVTNL